LKKKVALFALAAFMFALVFTSSCSSLSSYEKTIKAYVRDYQLISKETFDSPASESWSLSNSIMQNGEVSVNGDETWNSYIVQNESAYPNMGVSTRFKFDPDTVFGIAMSHGTYQTSSYRDIGFFFEGDLPKLAANIGTKPMVTDNLNNGKKLKPDTWYRVTFFIDNDLNLFFTLWPEDNIDDIASFLYKLEGTDRNFDWRFTASAFKGKLIIEEIDQFEFSSLVNSPVLPDTAMAAAVEVTQTATKQPTSTPTPAPTATPTPMPVLFSDGAIQGDIELIGRYGLGTVYESEFSPDNSQIAYANQFGLYLYNVSNNAIDLFLPSSPVLSVNFSPDGKWIAYGNKDGVVKVWDIEQGKEIASLQDSDAMIKRILFSLDQQYLLFSDSNGRLVVYSTDDWSFYKRHELGYIGDMQPLPDGTRVLVSAHNKGVLGLDTNGWGLLNQYTTFRYNNIGHWFDSEGIAISPDSTTIAVGHGHFRFFPILNIKTGELEKVVTIEPGGKVPADIKMGLSIHALKYIEDGKKLFFISDGGAGLIDIEDDYRVIEFSDTLWSYSPIKISLSNDDKQAAIGGGVFNLDQWKFNYPFYSAKGLTDGTLVSVNPNDGKKLFREEAPLFKSGNYALEIDGQTGEIALIESSTGNTLFSEKAHTPMPKTNVVGQTFYYALIKTAVMPDESMFITGGADKSLKLWHTATDPAMVSLGSLKSDVDQIVISPDSSKVLASDSSGNLYLVDQTGTKKPTLLKHFDEIHALVISPDSTRLAIKDMNGIIHIYSLLSDLPEEILKVKPSIAYKSAVKSSNFVLFTPDSKVLVSVVRDQQIDIIKVDDGQLLTTIYFPERIDNMQFSTDGTRLNIMGSSVQSWGVR